MWSPQLYLKLGTQEGHSTELLERAISQSDAVIYSEYSLPSILSLKHLAVRTGVSYESLRSIVSRSAPKTYNKFSIRKRSGGRRYIHVPSLELMHAQRWINEHILKKIKVHPSSHAFIEGSSIQKCASKHCGAKWLIKLDITDFFESISEIQIFRSFKELGYQPLVSFELARLCTVSTHYNSQRRHYIQWRSWYRNESITDYNNDLIGYLPQGAPTSPLLSNIVMRRNDEELKKLAHKFKLTYTRYSDDLSFSTRSKNFDRCKAKELVFEVYRILSKSGYLPQYRKTKLISPSSKKVILGLNVDGDTPRLQKEFKDRLRQHFYYIKKLGLDEHIINREFDSVWGFKSHLRGMIDYANMIEPEYAKKQLETFKSINWPI